MKSKIQRLSEPAVAHMLAGCPQDTMQRWEFRSYEEGDIVCEQDEVYDYFFIILEGQASVYRMAESGKRYIQSIYGKGEYFGELEIFGRYPFICAIEAVTPLHIMCLPRDSFMRWIRQDHEFLLYITRTLCDSFYELSKKTAEDMLYSLTYRVCRYFVGKIAGQRALEQPARISTNKRLLSELFGVTQRSVNRVLRELQDEQLIEVQHDSILVLNPVGLEEKAERERDE